MDHPEIGRFRSDYLLPTFMDVASYFGVKYLSASDSTPLDRKDYPGTTALPTIAEFTQKLSLAVVETLRRALDDEVKKVKHEQFSIENEVNKIVSYWENGV